MILNKEQLPVINPADIVQLEEGTVLCRWIDPGKVEKIGAIFIPSTTKQRDVVLPSKVEVLKVSENCEFKILGVAVGKRYLRNEQRDQKLVFKYGEGDDETVYFIDDSENLLAEVCK